jgi:hypothetical protein
VNLFAVAQFFQQAGYEWKFKDGRHTVPTQEDIEEAVQNFMDVLADEPSLTQVEGGRLIVQKQGNFYDVYVHIAEIPRNPDE